ncbi:MAG: PHB depolymerase family esterase [Polaromonas sp.]
MNPTFQRLMTEVSRLTQTGKLRDATAAIQAALRGGKMPAAGNDTSVIDIQAREVKRGAASPLRPAATSTTAGQFITGSHTETAGTRKFKLYVPPGHAGKALPLVVMLHGCTQNPDDFAAGTGMNEAALKRGFFVLYPAQAQTANPSRCWNWFKHNHQRRERGEPTILAGMTREVMKQRNIDPQNVYVAGLSAGGAMAAILGDAYPELFAAVGVHSGLATGSAINVQQALSVMKDGGGVGTPGGQTPPTIVFHGDQDSTVHPANGEQVVAASAGAAAPELERARSANGRDYTRRIYREAGGRVLAEHWAVHGAGHAWSGGSTRGSYTDVTGPDATQEMLRFFFAHPLRAAR